MKKIIKYSFLSMIPLGLDLLTYYLLVNFLEFNVYISFVLAFFIGSIIAFIITPFIFGNNRDFKKYYLKFLLIETFGVFLGEFVFIYIFYSLFDINYFLSKIFAVGIIFLFTFSLKNKLLK